MSDSPLTLDRPAVSTPASEWAQSATSEINQTHARVIAKDKSDEADREAGIVTSDIPGAFPHGDDEETRNYDAVEHAKTYLSNNVDVQGMSETAKQYVPAREDVQSTLANAAETAKQYVPATEDVQATLANAAATAKQYLPESVAQKLPNVVSSGPKTEDLPVDMRSPATPVAVPSSDVFQSLENIPTVKKPADLRSPATPVAAPSSDVFESSESIPTVTVKKPTPGDDTIDVDVTSPSNAGPVSDV